EGDLIILVGELGDGLGGSRFLKVCHGKKLGPPPQIDLAHEIKIQKAVRDLIHAGLAKSAHDCSEGGLAVAIAECSFNPKEKLTGPVVDLYDEWWKSIRRLVESDSGAEGIPSL